MLVAVGAGIQQITQAITAIPGMNMQTVRRLDDTTKDLETQIAHFAL